MLQFVVMVSSKERFRSELEVSPVHLRVSSNNWKDPGHRIHRRAALAGPGCAVLGSYLGGGFVEVTDCFHSSQLPVPILAYKHR